MCNSEELVCEIWHVHYIHIIEVNDFETYLKTNFKKHIIMDHVMSYGLISLTV